MAFVDYYKILGVDKNIPQKDVRAAYRKRAKQFHPDLHPNDPKAKAKFQALNEAYEVISDPDKRAKYDQYGEQWKNADAFGGFGGAGGAGGSGSYGGAGGNPFEGFDFSQFGGGGGFSSFFENLFGGRGRSQQSAEGFGSGNFGGFKGSAGYGSGFNGAGYGAGARFRYWWLWRRLRTDQSPLRHKDFLPDEPVSGLDPVATADMYQIINELNKTK